MEITKIEPRKITYRIIPGKEDEEYGYCMWASFIFDCDNGRLTIHSDAGDYTYKWGHNEHEDFMHLMSRINEEYLLSKLSDCSVFDIVKSKEETIENIKKYGIDYFEIENQAQLDSIIDNIWDIEYCSSEETFAREVSAIINKMSYDYIEIVKVYPYRATVIVAMFVKYLQPKIKEEFGTEI